jgi:outer membrane lipoprotein-sorting protein
VKILRTLSTTRLIAIAALAVIVAVVGATVAVAASGGGGATPPPKPLAEAVHDGLTGKAPAGITARITFTNKLFPSGAIVGATGSALMSGATGRLWANSNGGRLELQSTAGDVQVTWNDKKATIYDASSNTAYTFDLPPQKADSGTTTDAHAIPSVNEITKFLTDISKQWTVSGAEPSNVAGEQAYTVKVSPSHDGGLLGSAQLAWDALNGVPLRIAIYAQGASSPALALEATQISFGDVPNSDVQVSPPAGAKVVDLSSQTNGTGTNSGKPITGLAPVQAAAGFPVIAPDTLVGLPRKDVRLVGPADSRAALVVYGQGLGAIVLVERAKDAQTNGGAAGALGSLPTVSVGGVTGHELATQLGTILTWDRAGVTYVLAGSVPNGAAETAAAALR